MGISFTLDCNDLDRMEAFWCAVLGHEAARATGPYRILRPGPAGGPIIVLQQVPEPKTAKSRWHLDYDVEDLEAEVARVTALGATEQYRAAHDMVEWVTMADPEGNEFCIEHVRT